MVGADICYDERLFAPLRESIGAVRCGQVMSSYFGTRYLLARTTTE